MAWSPNPLQAIGAILLNFSVVPNVVVNICGETTKYFTTKQ